jgi:hypothetical protein
MAAVSTAALMTTQCAVGYDHDLLACLGLIQVLTGQL